MGVGDGPAERPTRGRVGFVVDPMSVLRNVCERVDPDLVHHDPLGRPDLASDQLIEMPEHLAGDDVRSAHALSVRA